MTSPTELKTSEVNDATLTETVPLAATKSPNDNFVLYRGRKIHKANILGNVSTSVGRFLCIRREPNEYETIN